MNNEKGKKMVTNKRMWRYIYNYKVDNSNDLYYFDITTDQGKKMADNLAMEYMIDIKNWHEFTFIKRKLAKYRNVI